MKVGSVGNVAQLGKTSSPEFWSITAPMAALISRKASDGTVMPGLPVSSNTVHGVLTEHSVLARGSWPAMLEVTP